MTGIEARSILGLPPTFSPPDLKRAYRRAAATNHPDRGGDVERMVAVNEAYDVLSGPARGEDFYRETEHERITPEHPAESYIRRVAALLSAVWWIAGMFDLLDQPRRLRPWILIGFPFAYVIVWPLVRFAVRCGIHVYNFGVRLPSRFRVG